MAKLRKCHKFSDHDEDRRKAGLSEPAKFKLATVLTSVKKEIDAIPARRNH
jgi:hypothetical protein